MGRFLAQHSVAMLKQCCHYWKQCRNDVARLCCATNRRCESSRVTLSLVRQLTHQKNEIQPPFLKKKKKRPIFAMNLPGAPPFWF